MLFTQRNVFCIISNTFSFMRKWSSVWPKDVDLNLFFILISVRSTRIVHKYLCYSKIHVLLTCRNSCTSFMLFDYNIFWSERDNTNIKRKGKHFKLTWALSMHTCCAKPFVFNKKHANKISWQLFVLSNFHQIGIHYNYRQCWNLFTGYRILYPLFYLWHCSVIKGYMQSNQLHILSDWFLIRN